MIQATDLKNGTTFILDKKLYQTEKYTHQKIGRGGASVKLSLRDLETGDLVEKTLNSAAKVEEIETVKKRLQYLYNDSTSVIFMDPNSFEQIEIPLKLVENQLLFIKEGDNVDVLFWDDKPLNVDIPAKTTLEVTETPPGVKGDTASNTYKKAKLENGLSVKVPLFIKEGDRIRVDTKTGEYIERAK
jgi:elongation factor P